LVNAAHQSEAVRADHEENDDGEEGASAGFGVGEMR
jgi:hypothetical protein